MIILGIETSCDDTALALVRNGTEVLAQVRKSQTEHNQWGGVVPELAARLHADDFLPVLRLLKEQSPIPLEQIDAIAVTQGPGLQNSLLIGTTAATLLGLILQKPIIPVHHIKGHIHSIYLERLETDIKYPALVLTVSGGHTQMHMVKNALEISLIGTTRDDACGEVFDKVSKMLGLGYPGGPIVSERAESGNRRAFDLPRIYLEKESLDFSFSGLKSAVQRLVDGTETIDDNFINDLCASFEFAVGVIFDKKITRALSAYPEVEQIHFVGGVSANTYLREIMANAASRELLVPAKIEYCTDNAAMIASAGYWERDKATLGPVQANSRMKF